MASIPPLSTVQPRVSVPNEPRSATPLSPLQEQDQTTFQTPETASIHEPTTSEASSSNTLPPISSFSSPTHSELQDGPIQTASSLPIPSSSDISEPRKCWICFADETEDTPLSSEWRSPCPCALTAHELCLLDWIADLQAPGSRKRTDEIRCPQCKSRILVDRPRSLILDAANTLDRAERLLIIPGLVMVVGGCVASGCLLHGLNTVYVLFGKEDADQILSRGFRAGTNRWVDSMPNSIQTMARFFTPSAASFGGWNWRLGLGLPLIPVILVLSRTNLADSVLPILPIIFFATQTHERERLDLTHWPPSAAMTLAVLPYLRGAYNELFERTFGERLKKWAKEVQRKSGDVAEDGRDENAQQGEGPGAEPADEFREGDLMIGINLEVDIVEEGDGEDVVPPALDAPPQAGLGQAPEAAALPANVPAQPPAIQHANNLVISTGQIARKIIGALMFPLISSAMGSFLKHILPESWTTGTFVSGKRPSGLLQTRWGRNIIGGCLFVVLKDAVTVYARWKHAQSHRHRRVLNYDKRKAHTS